ncbi:hypothetical protein EUA93_18945 [Nocardioides oleivorans]|uniref:DUF7674 domain-containing protein n=1 Tax=Nocardioides oleivorans TaxID=273676 RepID=A0A4V1RK46_9ACTN|nr:hypothetical protein [Nocardioides oleivorans]RYB91012.1 hypothetical protein EUA93_18945 [Nocardioides oleivorans]
MAITAAQVPGLLVAASGWIAEAWQDAAEDNADPDSPGGRLGYLDAGAVVSRLADELAAGRTDGFDVLFDLVERLVTEGDDYVSELGVIGYLEGMQMDTVTSRGLDPEAFAPWLRPTSARYWAALHRFWESGTPIPDLRS